MVFKRGNKYIFKKGYHPPSEFKKGYHPSTEFKRGCIPWSYIDGNWNKRKRNSKEAIKVWCESNQIYRLPTGCLIHHIDINPMNNNSENLQLMDKRFHNQLHNKYFKLLKTEDII